MFGETNPDDFSNKTNPMDDPTNFNDIEHYLDGEEDNLTTCDSLTDLDTYDMYDGYEEYQEYAGYDG